MLESSRWLHQWRVRTNDTDAGIILDFAFDASNARVRFWFIATGVHSRECDRVVPADHLRARVSSPGIFHASMTARPLRSYPALVETGAAQEQVNLSPLSLWRWLVSPAPDPHPWLSESDLPSTWAGKGLPGRLTSTLRLWTSDELAGYCVQSESGEVGGLGDILVDLEQAVVRYLVVECWNTDPGETCIVPMSLVDQIDERRRKIWVGALQTPKVGRLQAENDTPVRIPIRGEKLSEGHRQRLAG